MATPSTREDDEPAAGVSRRRSSRRRSWWATAAPAAAVVVAVAAGAASLLHDQRPPAAPAQAVPAGWRGAVEVSSDAPRATTLEELVAASDTVVRAEVVATERGRWFGDADGGTRIQSRFATLQVVEVLRGVAPAAGNLLLEEEGWLEDGSPLVVDGAAPTQVGNDGIWFVVDGGDPQVGAHVIVSDQGRYLVTGSAGRLAGATGDDPLIARLAALTLDELVALLRMP